MLTEEFTSLQKLLLILCVLLTGGIVESACASEQSKELVAQGIEELKRQNHEKALKKFIDAQNADKDDQQALFFKAATLNRLGRFNASRIILTDLKKKGFEHSEFDFEMGWSFMGTKAWNEALSSFESYEKAHSGRGQTMEFIGRCYFAVGQYDKAEAALRQALVRDLGLKSTVEFYLAMLENNRNNKEEAAKHIMTVMDTNSPLGMALREMAEVSTATSVETAIQKKFVTGASAIAGYNDNVIGIGKTIPLPADITHKDSAFQRVSANLSYGTQKGKSGVNAGYVFLADSYNSIPRVNIIDNYAYADYLRALGEKLTGTVRISDEYTFSGGHRFRNQAAARSALVWRMTKETAAEFYYSYSASNYLFNNPVAAWNRDSHADTAGATLYFILDGKPLANAGYSHAWNHAKGSDFAFQNNTISVRAGYPLFLGFSAEAAYTYSNDNYDNPNSLSFESFARADQTDNYFAQIKKSIGGNINAFVQYNGTRAHSNILFYSFNQNVWSGGVNATW